LITSYDYNAPIAENGGHNRGNDREDKYEGVRSVLGGTGKGGEDPPEGTYADTPLMWHMFDLEEIGGICGQEWKELSSGNTRFPSHVFAELGLYHFQPDTHAMEYFGPIQLLNLQDYAYIWDDKPHAHEFAATPHMEFETANKRGMLITVENKGHINFGEALGRDVKGVDIRDVGNTNNAGTWRVCHLSEEDIKKLVDTATHVVSEDGDVNVYDMKQLFANVFRGVFEVQDPPLDTFVSVEGTRNGNIFINGINIGRYKTDGGPQKQLYVPAPFLHAGNNTVAILELSSPLHDRKGRVASFTPRKSVQGGLVAEIFS